MFVSFNPAGPAPSYKYVALVEITLVRQQIYLIFISTLSIPFSNTLTTIHNRPTRPIRQLVTRRCRLTDRNRFRKSRNSIHSGITLVRIWEYAAPPEPALA